MASTALSILKQYWGYTSFRGIQEDIIRSITEGRDTLGLMPTGGGKSITFQVPALAMEGLCIVVTPLIALMRDQVQNLRRRGIRAIAIYSGMTREEIIIALENCIFGNYKLLYISPERVDSEIFRTKLRRMHVSMVAVDESHCISQWGYDFRPAYLRLAELRDLLPPGVPVLALTATATPEVVDDIQEKLRFRAKNVFRMSFERQNLTYVVRAANDKGSELTHILQRMPGSAIVYVRNRRRTREYAEMLCRAGISAEYYHAGLDQAIRDQRQQRWTQGEVRVIVATNAFGMGIDKPDVRLVIHMDLPDSLEAYFQEAGRAGRDGERAYAVILYEQHDLSVLRQHTASSFPKKEQIREVYEHLQYYYQMAMGDGQDCIRQFDIVDFCRKFRHFPVQVDSALRLLALGGYIEYCEEPESASRLMFTIRRDELYRLKELGSEMERLIQSVLRTYTGLFSEYAFISERTLASHTGLTADQVYHLLLRLSQLRIVHYIPAAHLPRIIYRRPRVEADKLVIPTSVYEDRKLRYERRTAAMADYVQNVSTCRSRLLLRYFGERNEHNCGQCDTCIRLHLSSQTSDGKVVDDSSSKRKNGNNGPSGGSTLSERILGLLADGPLSASDVVNSFTSTPLNPSWHTTARTKPAADLILGVDREAVIQALQGLLDAGKVWMQEGIISLDN